MHILITYIILFYFILLKSCGNITETKRETNNFKLQSLCNNLSQIHFDFPMFLNSEHIVSIVNLSSIIVFLNSEHIVSIVNLSSIIDD